jgi:hypothetical protein
MAEPVEKLNVILDVAFIPNGKVLGVVILIPVEVKLIPDEMEAIYKSEEVFISNLYPLSKLSP